MFETLLIYFGSFVALLVLLLLLLEIFNRSEKLSGRSDKHLSQRWVRQLNEK
jgi:hypothetical protein